MPSQDSHKRVVLFHRDFQRFTGGHLKVWDYFNHVLSSSQHDPWITFTARSRWDRTNPWFSMRDRVTDWNLKNADLLFLAGTDWRALSEPDQKKSDRPIFNLIQHPRHAEIGSELRGFLRHRAIRICVSEEVASAIRATGEVNGPVHVIPNGVDVSAFPQSPAPFNERSTDVLICGLKSPDLARDCYQRLAKNGRIVRWLIDWVPRHEYLAHLGRAKITLFLPRKEEGFYLPALEGMGAGTVVVCTDCLGNRSFCIDRQNCLRPENRSEAIVAATEKALQLGEAERDKMISEGLKTFREHSLERERAAFLPLLERTEEIWKA